MKSVTDFMANVKGLTRNPLGIIALFISLIYGIAGLVLTISNNTLDINQNWVLIWFVVFFPVLILITFVYLVVNHHQKLYGPGDYKDERNFFRPLNSFEREQKLKEDIKLISDEQPEIDEESINYTKGNTEIEKIDNEKDIESTDSNNKDSNALEKLKKTSTNFIATLENFYLLVEELVLKRLDSELNVQVSRQMALDSNKGTVQFDGVAFKQNETIGIEVKYINSLAISTGTIEQIRKKISKVVNNYKLNDGFRFIVVFVSDKPIVNFSRATNAIKSGFENEIAIDIRYYDLEDLKQNKL
ncbi:hypothetical protein SAMN05428961_104682 [Paenibacillus sp. OK060]|uniref:hypothetical protein n=1 Tax=Paenibacillus sp. OK060 TaxID=1881034 RepID=UPI0008816BCC|nr:hypothetical protein [Paenibacillus sp. OK060]SDL33419.1 hypothetical protein SAMN05428961_104682 [Paenibacillus sp. OK060]